MITMRRYLSWTQEPLFLCIYCWFRLDGGFLSDLLRNWPTGDFTYELISVHEQKCITDTGFLFWVDRCRWLGIVLLRLRVAAPTSGGAADLRIRSWGTPGRSTIARLWRLVACIACWLACEIWILTWAFDLIWAGSAKGRQDILFNYIHRIPAEEASNWEYEGERNACVWMEAADGTRETTFTCFIRCLVVDVDVEGLMLWSWTWIGSEDSRYVFLCLLTAIELQNIWSSNVMFRKELFQALRILRVQFPCQGKRISICGGMYTDSHSFLF